MVMLRCVKLAGASITLIVKVPLEDKLGSLNDGNLKPATAKLPIISIARRTPIAPKNPASRMLSDIFLFALSELQGTVRHRRI